MYSSLHLPILQAETHPSANRELPHHFTPPNSLVLAVFLIAWRSQTILCLLLIQRPGKWGNWKCTQLFWGLQPCAGPELRPTLAKIVSLFLWLSWPESLLLPTSSQVNFLITYTTSLRQFVCISVSRNCPPCKEPGDCTWFVVGLCHSWLRKIK